MMPLKLCANGGMKLDATGLAVGCCDPCEISIDRERERIQLLPSLSNFFEGGEGLLVVDDTFNETTIEYYVKHVFAYTVYDENEGWNVDVLEYFDCENCERIVLYSSYDGFMLYPYRFFALPDACNGCIIKYNNAQLLATIDESGTHEPTYDNFIYRAVYSYTNNTDKKQCVFYKAGGNDLPNEREIDNWAQLLKNGEVPTVEGEDIYSVLLYPNETVTLYIINESHNQTYNPWEIHCKVYAADITCDSCEIAIEKAIEDAHNVIYRFGVGYYTGNGANTPCRAAFVDDEYDHYTLYGFTCDTCEKVVLWDAYAWDVQTIPYTEDDTACDGEGEVQ